MHPRGRVCYCNPVEGTERSATGRRRVFSLSRGAIDVGVTGKRRRLAKRCGDEEDDVMEVARRLIVVLYLDLILA